MKDYELVLDWDFKWESPSEDSNFDANLDIDDPEHIKDYLDWWQGCSPHNLNIHEIDQVGDEKNKDIGGT